MGVTVGDIDTLMSDTIRDGYRTEAHVDQQRYMTVSNSWNSISDFYCTIS